MAQRVEVVRIDDLDGSAAAGSVRFGIDGRAYEIDLSTQNAARLRRILAPFVAAARRTEENALGQIPRDASDGAPPKTSRTNTPSVPGPARNSTGQPKTLSLPQESSCALSEVRVVSAPRVRTPIPTNPFQVPS